MKSVEAESETPLPLGQLVKMSAPVVIFGVILPFVDMITDLRMITRLYVGVGKPIINGSSYGFYTTYGEFEYYGHQKFCQDNPRECQLYRIYSNSTYDRIKDPYTYCQDNPEECWTEREQHPMFATMLLGIKCN